MRHADLIQQDGLMQQADLRKRSFNTPYIYTTVLTAWFLMTIATGCTKKFESLNTDPTTFSTLTAATIPQAFARSEYEGIYGDAGIYELARSLFQHFDNFGYAFG